MFHRRAQNLWTNCMCLVIPLPEITIRDWLQRWCCIIRRALMAAKIRTLYLNRSVGREGERGCAPPAARSRLDGVGNRTLFGVGLNWGLDDDVSQRAEDPPHGLTHSTYLTKHALLRWNGSLVIRVYLGVILIGCLSGDGRDHILGQQVVHLQLDLDLLL